MRAVISVSHAGVPATTVRPSTTRSDFSHTLIQITTVGWARASARPTAQSTIPWQRSECGVIASFRVVVMRSLAMPHPNTTPWSVRMCAEAPAAARPGYMLHAVESPTRSTRAPRDESASKKRTGVPVRVARLEHRGQLRVAEQRVAVGPGERRRSARRPGRVPACGCGRRSRSWSGLPVPPCRGARTAAAVAIEGRAA